MPGESKVIRFVIHPSDFAFTGRDNKKIIESGLFQISIANHTIEFKII